jgi:hypothetical protein
MERLKRKEGDRELVEEEERRRDQVLRSVTAGECVGETVLVTGYYHMVRRSFEVRVQRSLHASNRTLAVHPMII